MSLVQGTNGEWIDDPATAPGGQRLNDNFVEIFRRAPKVNYSGTGAPLPTNDETQGYRVNSIWRRTSDRALFICRDATTDGALWLQIAGADAVASLLGRIFDIKDEDTEILSGKGLVLEAISSIIPPSITFPDPDTNAPLWKMTGYGDGGNFTLLNLISGLELDYSPTGRLSVDSIAADGSSLTGLTASQITDLGTAALVNTGTASGNVPVLDGAGLLPSSVFPPILTTEVTVVGDEASMLALDAQTGDIAIRSDLTPSRTFILTTNDPTTLSNWIEIQAASGVSTVNGLSGTVTLTYSSVGALPQSGPTWSGVASGDGSGITTLNASSLSSGTVANARTTGTAAATASTLVLRDSSGDSQFHSLILSGQLDVTSNITASGTITGNGSGLSQLNATALSSGTVADARLSANIPLKGSANTFTDNNTFNRVEAKQFNSTTQTLTDGATINWNMDLGTSATVTLAGNRTLANPTSLIPGTLSYLIVKQDGTGGRTLSFGANFKWSNGIAPVLSTAANAVDILTFLSDGTYVYGTITPDFS